VTKTRIEKDSMGEVKVPEDALYSAHTQRAVENFPISGLKMPRRIIQALGLIKAAAAKVNADLKLLDPDLSNRIIKAANSVANGEYDQHFPIDIFQTGSGTSSNMNTNEVIAHLASKHPGDIHPNDHVNMCQSSNDVIPAAIHISCSIIIHEKLLPSLHLLADTLGTKAHQLSNIIKTGRTHLMDAMPLTMGQELSGWQTQIINNIDRINNCLPRLQETALGGTAVGTGINAHPVFGTRIAKELSSLTKIKFSQKPNFFEALSCQDTIVELSGQLKTCAVSLMKIANDLRWMNSGPLTGLAEIQLPSTQAGSSIMPGKVNPVIAESVCMVAAQVIGNDTAITIAGQAGNFQLNVMLPVIAYNILQSIEILASASKNLAEKAIKDFVVNSDRLQQQLAKNPILVTALNSEIGYEKGAEIAKRAYKENRSVREVAQEMTTLNKEHLDKLLNPELLIRGGIQN
jgi:fumarate hydratase, class II